MENECPFDDRRSQLAGSISHRQIYTALRDDEIRTLLLAPGTKSDPVVVELEVITSTKGQQYEAVSYVWGSTRGDNYIVKCNNIDFAVTKSLGTAFLHLRYPSTWRRLWVDQICIDQSNEDELMAQVRKMGAIYSHSSRVVVWMGLRDNAMSQAWKVLQDTCHSPSLVRSDFLDASPGESAEQKQKRDSQISRVSSEHFAKGHSTPTKRKSTPHRSSPTITRPLRSFTNSSISSLTSSTSSFMSSTTSLSSSTSSLSSLVSSLNSSSDSLPRTPIRKNYRHRKSLSSTKVSPGFDVNKIKSPPQLKLALSIFQHPYFTRLWTFQEIVLSPAAIFVSNGIEFALADLMSWYFHHVSKPMFFESSRSTTELKNVRGETMVYDSIGSFENIIHLRHEITKVESSRNCDSIEVPTQSDQQSSISFSTLLMLTRHLQTLKAEDRVLSLLGLHQGFSDYLGRITEADGWLPVPELFLAAFRYCIEIEQSLDILSAAGVYTGNERKGFEGWPSWLPDWREAYPLRPLPLANSKIAPDDDVTATKSHKLLHKACHGIPVDCVVTEDEYGYFKFSIAGCRVGVVVTKPGSWPSRYFIPERHIINLLRQRRSQPGRNAQSTSDLTQNSADSEPLDHYSSTVIIEALQREYICDPLSTFASVRTGDWVCMLFGGSVLYILRPIITKTAKSTNLSGIATQPTYIMAGDGLGEGITEGKSMPSEPATLKCRFIGECSIDAFTDGSLGKSFVDAGGPDQRLRFDLL